MSAFLPRGEKMLISMTSFFSLTFPSVVCCHLHKYNQRATFSWHFHHWPRRERLPEQSDATVHVSAEGPDRRLSRSVFSSDQCPDPAPGTSWGQPSAGGDHDGERPPEGAAEQRSPARPLQVQRLRRMGCAGPTQVFLSSRKWCFSEAVGTSVLFFFNFSYF